MKHLFIPYELALLAKEKGFDEPCFAQYEDEYGNGKYDHFFFNREELTYTNSELDKVSQFDTIAAPLYQQIIDWFREKHNWNIEISYKQADKMFRGFIYPIQPNTEVHFSKGDKDYYEAIKIAIEEAFNLI